MIQVNRGLKYFTLRPHVGQPWVRSRAHKFIENLGAPPHSRRQKVDMNHISYLSSKLISRFLLGVCEMIHISLFVRTEENIKYYVENIRRHRNKISSPGRQGDWILKFVHLETHTYFQPQHISSLFPRKK